MEDKERYLEQIKAELGDIDLYIKAIDLTIFDKDNLRDIRDDIVKARQKIVLNDQINKVIKHRCTGDGRK